MSGSAEPSVGGVPLAVAEIAWAIGDELAQGAHGRTPRLSIVIMRGPLAILAPVPLPRAADSLPAAEAVTMLARQAARSRAPEGLARLLRDPDAYGTAVTCKPGPDRKGATAVLACTDRAGFGYEGVTFPGPQARTETIIFRPGTWHASVHQALARMTELLAPGTVRRDFPEPDR